MERKSFPTADVKVADGDLGILEAIVSVFSNVDSDQERVMPGFFADSLARKLPKGVWSHNWDLPVAKTLEARELSPGDPLLPESIRLLGGLYIKGQFNMETQRGREAFSDIKFGIIDEYSIGYKVDKDSYDNNTHVRDLLKGTLFEWSPVLVGANSATATISAKSIDDAEPITYADQADETVAVLKAFVERSQAATAARAKEGRAIGRANRERIRTVLEAMDAFAEVRAELELLIAESEPDPPKEDDPPKAETPDPTKAAEAQRLFVRSLILAAQMQAA